MKLSFGKIIFFVIAGVVLIMSFMAGCPAYNVYQKQQEGRAELEHAKYQKEVQVAEAKGKYDAANYLLQADTIAARAIALSNEIIGSSLRNNKEYLQYLWIQEIDKANVIYVPTSSNLPQFLEAGRGHGAVSQQDTLQ